MSGDDYLEQAVAQVAANLPCSVELPAGTGKTETIAALARARRQPARRSLILTHTNAGVDVLRRRIRKMRVLPKEVKVSTIDGYCFDLVRHFPQLSELVVPEEPNWDDSNAYHLAASRALRTEPIRRMLEVSYHTLIVDEYQDCLIDQHAAIVALAESIPTAVFGDPLQGLFAFGDNQPVSWSDVTAAFPPQALQTIPWRWRKTHPALGEWLLAIRDPLKAGEPIDLASAPVQWHAAGTNQIKMRVCLAHTKVSGSVAALGSFRSDCAKTALTLNGSYALMEELEGKLLLELSEAIDAGDGPAVAAAVTTFARDCATGVAAAFTAQHRRRLADGKPVNAPSRPELRPQHDAINHLLTEPTPANVQAALVALGRLPEFRLYGREAWHGALNALKHVVLEPELTVRSAVVRERNHLRVVGRRPEQRTLSRPLLAKGLEYDHAILLDADRYGAAELYVALSRGRRSVAVISKATKLRP